MYQKLAQQAIAAALALNWQKAQEANAEILSLAPEDTDALNRLAKACYELGNTKKAIEICQRVLEIDPLNTIAMRCVDRYSSVKPNGNSGIVDPSIFLEEPGKTKVVNLTHIGPGENYLSMVPGEEVVFSFGEHRVQVITQDGKYVGRLPDDMALRLIHFIKQGNEYTVIIKAVSPEFVRVFLREIKRSPVLLNTPSFALGKKSSTFISSKR